MKTIEFQHSLIDKEESFLKKLIGKDLCGIGSNSISIEPSHPELWWSFHEWIELSNWNDNEIIRLCYSFDETYSLDHFIELRIEHKQKKRKALNANISFSGKDKFTVKKIETYGYDSEYVVENLCGNLPKVGLKKDEKYLEKMQSENLILLYSSNKKRILIECHYSYLQLIVTLNEKCIDDRLNLEEPEFKAKMTLKRIIK